MTTRLFVYGTLAPGDDAWSVLAPWTVGEPVADAVPGVLFDTGRGYPAATFAVASAEVVHGVVVAIDPAREADGLAALDRYEGPEYERVTVETVGAVRAFAYAWIGGDPAGRPVPGGRWAVS